VALAIGRDNPYLLDQAAHDLESLTTVVRIAEDYLKSFGGRLPPRGDFSRRSLLASSDRVSCDETTPLPSSGAAQGRGQRAGPADFGGMSLAGADWIGSRRLWLSPGGGRLMLPAAPEMVRRAL
jgi:hypothetical protein